MHQKCSNYALTNLLFGLCRSMWIIDALITHPNPHFGAPTRPSTLEMLRTKKRTLIPTSIVFIFEPAFEYFKECGGASHGIIIPIGNLIHQSEPIPHFLKFTPQWILEWFATTFSTWGFYFPKFDYAFWIIYCPIIILQTPITYCSS
jgi:hypothetical protein